MITIDKAIESMRAEAESFERERKNPLSPLYNTLISKRRAEELEQIAKWLTELKELREKQTLKWIPVTYHEPTDEEREYYGDIEYILDCPLPEEAQEIIISCGGKVRSDICGWDGAGWYLESTEDWCDVDAWMPLPEPYEINSKIDSEVKIWHE